MAASGYPRLPRRHHLSSTVATASRPRTPAGKSSRACGTESPCCYFPEGTSSDGSSLLPFRSPLFDPAIRTGANVVAAAIRYHSDDAAEDRVAYWGDMVFLPHLFRTMCIRGLAAEITFDPPRQFSDRKTAAQVAWRQVLALRDQRASREQPVALLSTQADHLRASLFTGSPMVVLDMLSCHSHGKAPPPERNCSPRNSIGDSLHDRGVRRRRGREPGPGGVRHSSPPGGVEAAIQAIHDGYNIYTRLDGSRCCARQSPRNSNAITA